MGKSNYYVYFHINPLKNHVFYVGKGSNNRAYSKKDRSSLWFRTVNKYGYIVDIVEEGLSQEQAFEREKFYIKKIGRRDLGLGHLVNFTDGGDGITNLTKESRKKISDSKIGKPRPEYMKEYFRQTFKGQRRSPATEIKPNQHLSPSTEFKKGRENPNKKEILQYDINNGFLKEWPSLKQIQIELGIPAPNIHKVCNNTRKTAGGFIFKYKN